MTFKISLTKNLKSYKIKLKKVPLDCTFWKFGKYVK